MERIKNLGLTWKFGFVILLALFLVVLILRLMFGGYLNRELKALYGDTSSKGAFIAQLLADELEPFTKDDQDVQEVQQLVNAHKANYGVYGLNYIFLLDTVEPAKEGENVIADTLNGKVSQWLIDKNNLFNEDEPCKTFEHKKKTYHDCAALLRLPDKAQGLVRVGVLEQNPESSVWSEFTEKRKKNVFSWKFRLTSFFLILLMTVLLTLAFRFLVLGRIISISQATERMSFGDLETEVEVKSQDEIGNLEETLERMRANLKDAIERLKRRK